MLTPTQNKWSILTTITMVSVAFGTSVQAQGTDVFLEEIIVTATKRAESIQKVPIAVTALSGIELERAGVTDIQGLTRLVPSFFLSTTSSEVGGTTARIRGIGTQGNNPGLESAVGMYVDGIYRNRSTVGFTDLGEVERIEVLRGPQGTLFGRNTSAGALSVITRGPNLEEKEGYFRLSGGDYSLVDVRAGVSAPFSSTAAGRVDLTYKQRDGFFENDALTGQDYNTRDRYAVRGQLAFTPSDDVDIRIIGDFGSRDETCCAGVYIVKGARTDPAIEALDPTQTLTSDASNPFGRVTYTTPGTNLDAIVDEWGLSAEIVWDQENFSLTSITGYRDWDAKNGGNLDYSGGHILFRDPDNLANVFETFTQEIRLNGKAGRMDWLLGLFYSDESLQASLQNKVGADYSDFTSRVLGVSADASLGFPFGTVVLPPFSVFGADTASGDGSSDVWNTDTQSLAVFTHNTFAMTDSTALTVGLRFTDEEKDLMGQVVTTGTSCAGMLAATGFDPANPSGPITPVLGGLTNGALALQCLGGTLNSTLDGSYSDTRKESQLSGTLQLSHQFTDNVMGYASYASGYKSGGYNLDRSGLDPDTVLDGATSGPNAATNFGIKTDVNALEFEEETVDAFELGLKSTLADGRVTLNVAAFYQDFENFQLNTFNGLTFFVVTLDAVESKGIEMDISAAISDSFRANFGVAYIDAKYDDNIQRSDGLPATNLAGQQLTHAPEWSATAAIDYVSSDGVIGDWRTMANLNVRWMSEYNTGSDLDPEKHQDAYAVVNARLGLMSGDDRWSIELWAYNLFDEEYFQTAFDSPIQNTSGVQSLESFSAFLGDPRLIGLTLGYRY